MHRIDEKLLVTVRIKSIVVREMGEELRYKAGGRKCTEKQRKC